MARIKIEVTERDISFGKRDDCKRCPIAIAARRVGLNQLEVGGWYLTSGNTTYTLTKKARDFITDFDGGLQVSPFSFTICSLPS